MYLWMRRQWQKWAMMNFTGWRTFDELLQWTVERNQRRLLMESLHSVFPPLPLDWIQGLNIFGSCILPLRDTPSSRKMFFSTKIFTEAKYEWNKWAPGVLFQKWLILLALHPWTNKHTGNNQVTKRFKRLVLPFRRFCSTCEQLAVLLPACGSVSQQKPEEGDRLFTL